MKNCSIYHPQLSHTGPEALQYLGQSLHSLSNSSKREREKKCLVCLLYFHLKRRADTRCAIVHAIAQSKHREEKKRSPFRANSWNSGGVYHANARGRFYHFLCRSEQYPAAANNKRRSDPVVQRGRDGSVAGAQRWGRGARVAALGARGEGRGELWRSLGMEALPLLCLLMYEHTRARKQILTHTQT